MTRPVALQLSHAGERGCLQPSLERWFTEEAEDATGTRIDVLGS